MSNDRKRRKGHEGDASARGLKRAENPADSVFLKLLCPAARIGSVIGKGGEVVKQIRHLSNAIVKVHEDKRSLRQVYIESEEGQGVEICPAQDALLRVLARIMEVEMSDGTYKTPGDAEAKLLISKQFIGHILGKGGNTLQSIRKSCNARIKVYKEEEIPDEIAREKDEEFVMVSGGYEQVKASLLLITAQMREVVARNKNVDASHVATTVPVYPQPQERMGMEMQPVVQQLPLLAPNSVPGELIEMEYKLLVPELRIASIIGRGGEILKMLRAQTSARVTVPDPMLGVEERPLTFGSADALNSDYCAAADAMLRCIEVLIMDQSVEDHFVRLLIPAAQARNVLTQDTCRQIRHDTGVSVLVLQPTPGLPFMRNDEAVTQITGTPGPIMAAMRVLAALLRLDVVNMQMISRLRAAQAPQMDINMRHGKRPRDEHEGRNMPDPADFECLVKLTIPQEVVGVLLGVSGSHIKQIRKMSQSRIKLQDEPERGKDREVEIQGNFEHVQTAQLLIYGLLKTGAIPDLSVPIRHPSHPPHLANPSHDVTASIPKVSGYF